MLCNMVCKGTKVQARDTREEDGMQRFICDVCGYVYDPKLGDPEHGVKAGTPFEQVPADWVCPECGVGKDQFSPE